MIKGSVAEIHSIEFCSKTRPSTIEETRPLFHDTCLLSVLWHWLMSYTSTEASLGHVFPLKLRVAFLDVRLCLVLNSKNKKYVREPLENPNKPFLEVD